MDIKNIISTTHVSTHPPSGLITRKKNPERVCGRDTQAWKKKSFVTAAKTWTVKTMSREKRKGAQGLTVRLIIL